MFHACVIQTKSYLLVWWNSTSTKFLEIKVSATLQQHLYIEEKVNWFWAAENKLHANEPRDRTEATNNEENFIHQSATSTR
jgi:hypothetical protein